MERGKDSIARTLLYFQIFDYPLQKNEIWQFLNKKIPYKDFEKAVKNIPQKESFYFLKGNELNIKKRKKREILSNLKIKIAEEFARKVSSIPSLQLVGISGSLSMKNSEKNDDIDIFVISKTGFVWLTRLLLVLFFKSFGVYRANNDKDIKDKFCLNFIVGENKIKFSKSKRNEYLAHEIVQLLPIFQRDNSYKNFIKNNNWVGEFLPNFQERIIKNSIPINRKTTRTDKLLMALLNLLYIENLARIIQYVYMRSKITKEEIGKDILAFHPKDYKAVILKKLYSSVQKDTRGH